MLSCDNCKKKCQSNSSCKHCPSQYGYCNDCISLHNQLETCKKCGLEKCKVNFKNKKNICYLCCKKRNAAKVKDTLGIQDAANLIDLLK